MPKEIRHFSLLSPLSFTLFFCFTASPFLLSLFPPPLYWLCFVTAVTFFLLKAAMTRCPFCRPSQRGRAPFSQGDRKNLESSSLTFRSLMLLFALCMRLRLFFPGLGYPSLSISALPWQGTFTERCYGTEQCYCCTPPPPPLCVCASPKCQIQLVGKLQEPERICSTSPNNSDSSCEYGYK